jgi:plastocyanin
VRPIADRRSMLVTLVLGLGLAGVACSSDSTTSQTGNTTAPAGGGATLEQGTGDALVFSPTTLTVTKGTTISVSNVGSTAHTFTVTGQSIDTENQPGQSQQVTIDLTAGTYPFVCRFHEGEGMTGTLIVQE